MYAIVCRTYVGIVSIVPVMPFHIAHHGVVGKIETVFLSSRLMNKVFTTVTINFEMPKMKRRQYDQMKYPFPFDCKDGIHSGSRKH